MPSLNLPLPNGERSTQASSMRWVRVRFQIPSELRATHRLCGAPDISREPSRCILVSDIYLRSVLEIFRANVMESISLKLPEKLLEASDRCARALGIPRAEYIRRAVERMNREAEARARAERIARA